MIMVNRLTVVILNDFFDEALGSGLGVLAHLGCPGIRAVIW